MYYVIVKGSPEPILCRSWHALQMTLGELQRLGVEVFRVEVPGTELAGKEIIPAKDVNKEVL